MPPARPHKVVVFGVDGLVFSKVAPLRTPTLDALLAAGRFSETWLPAEPMAPTFSGPGWATIATGVWPDKHRVRSNNWGSTTNLARYPDFLTRIARADSAKSTFAIADWAPLTTDAVGPPIFTDEIRTKISVSESIPVAEADAAIAAQACAHFTDVGPDASFVYFHAVDVAGHLHGTEHDGYRTAIEQTDANLGKVIDAIRSRADYADEDWTFIVTTDHGHVPEGGHGGSTAEERRSFILEVGPGIPHGTTRTAKNVDIASTVLQLLGIAVSDLDGRVLGGASTDVFDTLLGSLDLGWTRTPPASWHVDDSRMGAGGATEWRGWSFTTDEFWTRSGRGQGRENNVRARGVFAVADSGQWCGEPGRFDSTLVSPDHDVAGEPHVLVGFLSHYRGTTADTATMTVSFDGGLEREVLRYSSDAVSQHERHTVPVPAGASTMTVRWRLSTGDNDCYWAIDDPRVTPGGVG